MTFLSSTVVGNVHFFPTTTNAMVPLGTWTHLAITYNGIRLRIFMNGTEVGAMDIGWPPGEDITPLTIGAGINVDGVSEGLDGQIDEVRLYDYALTAGEIADLARAF